MRTFLKWLAASCAAVVLMGIFFTLYSRFLVDYSLESLETAGRIAERTSATSSSLQVYRSLMQNALLDEAAQENLDIRNLAYLEMASRSATEDTQGDFRDRYKFYLGEVKNQKKQDRTVFLKGLDKVYGLARNLTAYLSYLWSYIQGRGQPRRHEQALDLTSAVLLSQAEAGEKQGDWDRAVSLYEKYLERNPESANAGYVSITLAGVKVKQKKWTDAVEILNRTRKAFAGQEEQQIAESLLRRIDTLKQQWQELEKTKAELAIETDPARIEKLRFKLALLFLRVERFKEAQTYLNQLTQTSDKNLKVKARFYLGWTYKLMQQYDISADVLSVLAEDTSLDDELRNGIKAELADIHYQKGDNAAALKGYHSLAGEGCVEGNSPKTADKAWVGLAELEQSFLYFNLGDDVTAGEKMGCLAGVYKGNAAFSQLEGVTQDAARTDFHAVAFANLQKGRVEQAREFFLRNQAQEPGEYLNYSGMAMVHILSANLNEAEKAARRGYQLKPTEFSSAVMGYVLAFENKPDQAIAFYLQSLELDAEYIPSRFNLTCLYLKGRQYREALKHLLELERRFVDSKSLLYSKVLNNLGCALWWLGKEEDALRRFKRAIEITPGYVDAELNLKQIRLDRAPQPVTVPQILNVDG